MINMVEVIIRKINAHYSGYMATLNRDSYGQGKTKQIVLFFM